MSFLSLKVLDALVGKHRLWNWIQTASFSKYISNSRTKRLPLTTVFSSPSLSIQMMACLETSGQGIQEGVRGEEGGLREQQRQVPHGQGDVHRARCSRSNRIQAEAICGSRSEAEHLLTNDENDYLYFKSAIQ